MFYQLLSMLFFTLTPPEQHNVKLQKCAKLKFVEIFNRINKLNLLKLLACVNIWWLLATHLINWFIQFNYSRWCSRMSFNHVYLGASQFERMWQHFFWWWIFHECFENFFFVCLFFIFFSKLTKTKSLLLLIVLWTLECWWEICSRRSVCWATDARTNRWRFIRLHREAVVADDLAAIGVVVALRQCRRELIEDKVAVLCTAWTVHRGVLL